MRVFCVLLSIFLSLIPPVIALEYAGKILDDRELKARAFSEATGGVYDVRVVFKGAWATLYFQDGSEVRILLQSAKVSDLNSIVGYGRLGYIPVNRSLSIGLEQDDRTFSPNASPRRDRWHIRIDPSQWSELE
jgi:hypothetical protein